jgi:hypothetical protein
MRLLHHSVRLKAQAKLMRLDFTHYKKGFTLYYIQHVREGIQQAKSSTINKRPVGFSRLLKLNFMMVR